MSLDEAGAVPRWTLADRLRKAREHRRMSQEQLADVVGISRRSVSTYESLGTRKRPVLLAWAMATGVRLEWLTGGDGPETPMVLPRRDSNTEPAGSTRLALVA